MLQLRPGAAKERKKYLRKKKKNATEAQRGTGPQAKPTQHRKSGTEPVSPASDQVTNHVSLAVLIHSLESLHGG